jgi:hypothetical protein
MRKLDHLNWVEELSFVSYGLRLGVRTNQPGLLDQLSPLLPPG